MTFLHPWLLGFGTAAIALPVVVHWLTRPRPVRLPISTLRFIQEAVRQRRAAHRLRDAIILILRTLAVLLLAWAFARPLIGERPLVAPGESGDATRVVILDTSQSLGADVRGIQLFERARPAAAEFLAFSPGLRANLLLAAARPHPVFEQPSGNLSALREALAGAHVRPERMDVQAAVALAAEMLAKAPGGDTSRRELVIVSDFQRTGWGNVDFSILPEKTRIQLESVAPAETPPNLALLGISNPGHSEQGGPVELEAEVGNYSPTPRTVQVEFSVGGAAYRAEGLCPPNGRTRLSTTAILQAGGWQAGQARLLDVEDALSADNVRPFVLNVRPGAVYLLVTREPASMLASSSYYTERALVPARPRERGGTEKVVRVSADRLDRDALAPADLVAIDHPGKLSAESIGLLAGLLQRGKPVIYVAAEPIDASNLRQLADAVGPSLKLPVEFMPATGQVRKDLRWVEIQTSVPPFSLFGDGVIAAVEPLRFNGGLASRRLSTGLADDVLATYGDQTAALVASRCGSGTLAVLNVDLAASNLPASPLFVPMVGEIVARLLGSGERAGAVHCGDSVVIDLPPDAAPAGGLNVLAPGREADAGELADDAGGSIWRCTSLSGPGVYRIERSGVTCFALATAIPAEEGDLRAIEPAAFDAGAAKGLEIHYQSAAAGEDGHDARWVWLAVGCVACMLAEVVALKLLRS